MFDFREWLMDGFRDAVGKMADYKIIANSTGWYQRDTLMEEDLAELKALIDEKNAPPIKEEEIMTTEEPIIDDGIMTTEEPIISDNEII